MDRIDKIKWYLKSYKGLFFKSKYLREKEKEILSVYNNTDYIQIEGINNGIICMFDGSYMHGGLTDRFRGICSIYDFCKKHQIPFYICYTKPFNLTDYLIPNQYNWLIETENINFKNADVAILNDWEIPYKLHNLYLRKILFRCRKKQIIMYSNTNFRDYNFYKNYHELFKPSDFLQSELDKIIHEINTQYLTISFRFTTLLGDFMDCVNQPLSEEEQEILINDCLDAINKIYKSSAYKKVVVTADSAKFLKRASTLSYVYIIEGNIGHIDYSENDNSVLKTFLDYYIISKASEAFLVIGKGMYRSGFSRHAALMGNVKFTEYYIESI